MSTFISIDERLHDYLVAHGTRESPVLTKVREEAWAMGEDVAIMQIAPDQGALMTLLTKLAGAKRAIEVGTFTGYSAICVARALPTDGILVACELDPERARIALGNFAEAGVRERIDLRVGPAAETLAELEPDPPYDIAFIDADKTGYDSYYERCLELLRPGGLIVLDNVLQDGRVLEPAEDDESARAIDALNRKIAEDERVDVAMIGVADGLTLALKR